MKVAEKYRESEPEKYRFIEAQCGAAIRIAQNLRDHLPLEGSGFMQAAKNAARLAQLVLHLRPEGGYAQDYKLLNGDSGAWAISVVNEEGAALAERTIALAEALRANPQDYIAFDAGETPTQASLGVSVNLNEQLDSAIKQMGSVLLLWQNNLRINMRAHRNYPGDLLTLVDLAELVHEARPVDSKNTRNVTEKLARILVPTETMGSQLNQFVTILDPLVNEFANTGNPEPLRQFMLEELQRLLQDAERGRYLAPVSREMIVQIIDILQSNDPVQKRMYQQQLAQQIAQAPCYGVALSSVTRGSPGMDHVDLMKFEASKFGAIMIETGKLGLLAAHAPDMLESFADILMAGSQKSLKEQVKMFADHLEEKIQGYAESGQVNEGKLAILHSLLKGLRALQEGNSAALISVLESNRSIYPDSNKMKEFFRELKRNESGLYTKKQDLVWEALFQLIYAHMMAHNQYVQENGITHSRTGNMLCDCLAEALALFNGYTNGMNYDATSLKQIMDRAIETLEEKEKIRDVTTQIEQISRRGAQVDRAIAENRTASKHDDLEAQRRGIQKEHSELFARLQGLEGLVRSRQDKIVRLERLRARLSGAHPSVDNNHHSSASSSRSQSSSPVSRFAFHAMPVDSSDALAATSSSADNIGYSK